MQNVNFIKAFRKISNKHKSKNWKCLHRNCEEIAINSHLLQKNGILRQMATNNHVIELSQTPGFEKENNERIQIREVGINEAYSFPGFCNNHDSNLFKEIEVSNKVNLNSVVSQRLFAYRALCQELRRKQIAYDICTDSIDIVDIEMKFLFHWFREGLLEGIKNLMYFKLEFEKELDNSSELFFDYATIEIPKINICISSVFNINDDNNPLTKTHDENGSPLKKIIATSILNIFPYNNKSYILSANHKTFHCQWTSALLNNVNSNNYLKILSDLIVSRTEIWCASPELFKSIPKEKLEMFKQKWKEEVLNFANTINVDFSLFE